MKKPPKRALLIAGLLVLVIVSLLAWLSREQENTLQLSGNIEVTDARLSFKITGRLKERLVDEGDTVAQGQLIARLEPRDEELGVERAKAALAYSESMLKELETGSRRQEIDAARAELEYAQAAVRTAQAELERAQKDDQRYADLYAEGVISAADYDRFHTLFKTAQSRLAEAEARVRQTREQFSLREEGFRSEQIDQARARLKADQEALHEASQRLAYTELRAPFSGMVLSKAAEPGEYLNPGSSVVTIGDLQHPWLRAYVSELKLGSIKLGQAAAVSADTWPGRAFEGRIIFISSEAEFTPKTVQTFEERVKLVYRVKIAVENPQGELKPGMPADARISLQERK